MPHGLDGRVKGGLPPAGRVVQSDQIVRSLARRGWPSRLHRCRSGRATEMATSRASYPPAVTITTDAGDDPSCQPSAVTGNVTVSVRDDGGVGSNGPDDRLAKAVAADAPGTEYCGGSHTTHGTWCDPIGDPDSREPYQKPPVSRTSRCLATKGRVESTDVVNDVDVLGAALRSSGRPPRDHQQVCRRLVENLRGTSFPTPDRQSSSPGASTTPSRTYLWGILSTCPGCIRSALARMSRLARKICCHVPWVAESYCAAISDSDSPLWTTCSL